MALKDTLIHFANTDGYSSVLTKADYDSNLDKLADTIDTNTNNITTNTSDISTNKDNITKNANDIATKLNAILINDDGTFKRYLKYANLETTDATQTTITSVTDLPIKAIVNVDIYSQNLQDDYATKWIFEGSIYATIKDDGTITADKSLTDIVKDDSDWAFDIAGNDGDSSGGASIDLKVTGKDSTNIKWSVFLDVKINTF